MLEAIKLLNPCSVSTHASLSHGEGHYPRVFCSRRRGPVGAVADRPILAAACGLTVPPRRYEAECVRMKPMTAATPTGLQWRSERSPTRCGERVSCPRARPATSETSAFVNQNRKDLGGEPICREPEASAGAYWARRKRLPSPRAACAEVFSVRSAACTARCFGSAASPRCGKISLEGLDCVTSLPQSR